jgi:hypothetical protein
MKRENVSYLLIATLILASLTWFIIDVTYSPGYIELVDFKAELDVNGNLRENHADLKWHGANGTELRLYLIISEGSRWQDHELRYQTVNDGDVFTVSMPSSCPVVEIYYHNTEVKVNSDGQLSEHIFLAP